MYGHCSHHSHSNPSGDAVDLAKCQGDKVVVVEMWATWCPPCRTSIPHLTELAHKYGKDAVFLGITNEDAATAKGFVTKMGSQMDYTVASDSGGVSAQYMRAWQLQGIPSAVIVDKSGKMVWGGHPMDPNFESTLKKAIAEPGTAKASPSSSSSSSSSAPKINLQNETRESLAARSGKELKQIAADNHVNITGLLEKDEIINKLLMH
jgi:thiol-disulfide isomerase/thioredoxin